MEKLSAGDLVKILDSRTFRNVGYAIYLGRGKGMNILDHCFLWNGIITTFDEYPYWEFEIID